MNEFTITAMSTANIKPGDFVRFDPKTSKVYPLEKGVVSKKGHKEDKLIIKSGIKKVLGKWAAWFKIGNQGFTLMECETKSQAKYF